MSEAQRPEGREERRKNTNGWMEGYVRDGGR